MTYFESQPVETFVKPMKDQNGNFDFTEVDRAQARNYTQGSKIQMVRVITPAGSSAQEVRVTDGTNNLLLNSDGSLNISYPENALSIATNGTVATNNEQTLYTVPANKKAYIIAIQMSSTMASVASSNLTYLSLNGVKSLVLYMVSTTTAFNCDSTSLKFDLRTCPILTAGQTVKVGNTNTNCTTVGVVYYVEVAV